MTMTKKTSSGKLLPIKTIQAATDGDSIAMSIVLSNYQSYISKLATRAVYQEDGKMVMRVDEYMRRRLETKLIEKVLLFDPTR